VEQGKRRVQVQKVGKFIGKLFTRKDRKLREEEPTAAVAVLSHNPDDFEMIEGDEGLEFKVRSPVQSLEEEDLFIEGLQMEEQEKPNAEQTEVKSVGFLHSVAPMLNTPSDASLLSGNGTELELDFLEVEVDNEENHADDIEALPRMATKSIATSALSYSSTDAVGEIPIGDVTISHVKDMMSTVFGKLVKGEMPFDTSGTTGTAVLISQETTALKNGANLRSSGTLAKSKDKPKTRPKANPNEKAKRGVSTLEGMRLAAQSPTRTLKYPTYDEISFAPSQGSVNVLPKPSKRKAMPLKSAMKSTTPKSPNNKAKSLAFDRSRSTPTPKSLPNQRVVRTAPNQRVVRMARPRSQTNAHTEMDNSPIVYHRPPRTATQGYPQIQTFAPTSSSGMSVLSSRSTKAVADPLSPSSDIGSQVSSIKDNPNLDMVASTASRSTAWAPPVATPRVMQKRSRQGKNIIPRQQPTIEDWAEVNNAANVLGRAMSQVDVSKSVDTSDEAQHLHRLLSEDSAIGDVEQALVILKRHAQRLGVRESDLLLAAAKSEDSELMSVRSLTLGEEVMEMMHSYFRGRR
jgi:predicted transglutaminase-like cysteine proteinase